MSKRKHGELETKATAHSFSALTAYVLFEHLLPHLWLEDWAHLLQTDKRTHRMITHNRSDLYVERAQRIRTIIISKHSFDGKRYDRIHSMTVVDRIGLLSKHQKLMAQLFFDEEHVDVKTYLYTARIMAGFPCKRVEIIDWSPMNYEPLFALTEGRHLLVCDCYGLFGKNKTFHDLPPMEKHTWSSGVPEKPNEEWKRLNKDYQRNIAKLKELGWKPKAGTQVTWDYIGMILRFQDAGLI